MLSLFLQINAGRIRPWALLELIAIFIHHLLLIGVLVHEHVKSLSFNPIFHILKCHCNGSSWGYVRFQIRAAVVMTAFNIRDGRMSQWSSCCQQILVRALVYTARIVVVCVHRTLSGMCV